MTAPTRNRTAHQVPRAGILAMLCMLSLSACVGYAGVIPIAIGGDGEGNVAIAAGHLGGSLVPGVASVDCSAVCTQSDPNSPLCTQLARAAESGCTTALGAQK